jgi:DNA-binding PadR family transcriptional regulator
MYPVNQVILGGGDPMMSSIDNLDAQIQLMENYRNKLNQIQAQKQQFQQTKLIWDDINAEISPLSDEQKNKLLMDSEYAETYKELQAMVQSEILNLVKARIENTDKGKELLDKQLKIIKRLKTKIINDTNIEMEMFKKFKEYSKDNPGATYEEFIKNGI